MPGKGLGYVVDVQADLLSRLATRTVVPLLPEEMAPPAIGELNPIFEVQRQAAHARAPVCRRGACPGAEATCGRLWQSTAIQSRARSICSSSAFEPVTMEYVIKSSGLNAMANEGFTVKA